jgi:hypothetical protein
MNDIDYCLAREEEEEEEKQCKSIESHHVLFAQLTMTCIRQ